MWDRQRLQELADQEAQLFADSRLARLHAAIVRHDGSALEALIPDAEASRELAEAMQALRLNELQKLQRVAPTSRVLVRLISEAAKYHPTPTPEPVPDVEPEDDSEPEQT